MRATEFQNMRLVVAVVFAFLSGCAGTYGGTDTPSNTVISIQYGTVQEVREADMDPNTGTGAAMGGALGLAAAHGGSTGTQVGVAAAGALIGALIQRERAANNRAEQYSVLLNNGATIAIVSEHHDIQTGDCVAVEQGRHANIRRVSPVMCQDVANASHPHYADLHAANLAEASECERIKDEILAATTQEQVDLAYQKMRALCEH